MPEQEKREAAACTTDGTVALTPRIFSAHFLRHFGYTPTNTLVAAPAQASGTLDSAVPSQTARPHITRCSYEHKIVPTPTPQHKSDEDASSAERVRTILVTDSASLTTGHLVTRATHATAMPTATPAPAQRHLVTRRGYNHKIVPTPTPEHTSDEDASSTGRVRTILVTESANLKTDHLVTRANTLAAATPAPAQPHLVIRRAYNHRVSPTPTLDVTSDEDASRTESVRTILVTESANSITGHLVTRATHATTQAATTSSPAHQRLVTRGGPKPPPTSALGTLPTAINLEPWKGEIPDAKLARWLTAELAQAERNLTALYVRRRFGHLYFKHAKSKRRFLSKHPFIVANEDVWCAAMLFEDRECFPRARARPWIVRDAALLMLKRNILDVANPSLGTHYRATNDRRLVGASPALPDVQRVARALDLAVEAVLSRAPPEVYKRRDKKGTWLAERPDAPPGSLVYCVAMMFEDQRCKWYDWGPE